MLHPPQAPAGACRFSRETKSKNGRGISQQAVIASKTSARLSSYLHVIPLRGTSHGLCQLSGQTASKTQDSLLQKRLEECIISARCQSYNPIIFKSEVDANLEKYDETLTCNRYRRQIPFLKTRPSLIILIVINVWELCWCSFELNLKIQLWYKFKKKQKKTYWLKLN